MGRRELGVGEHNDFISDVFAATTMTVVVL